MTSNLKISKFHEEYHTDVMKEHKLFLNLLVSREKNEKKLKESFKKQYNKIPKTDKLARQKLKSQQPKRGVGRPRRCFDMETAKQIVRSEGIGSVAQYYLWYKLNTPAKMPKFPQRAYAKIWTGWGDFLGVYNSYSRLHDKTNGRGKYRTFDDAKLFARSLGLSKREDWLDFIKSGKCPADIPKRPDMTYSRGKRANYWLSWKDFLGYGSESTIDIIASTSPVLYIAKSRYSAPMNVYVINVIPGGRLALQDHIKKTQFKLIAAYYIKPTFNHKAILSKLSTYGVSIDEYIVPNIYELTGTFEESLDLVV